MSQGYTKGIPIDVDGTLSGNTDLLVPSQKAVKTYVDTLQTYVDGKDLQDAYNASADPELVTDATRGALTIKRGSAADTDSIQNWQNGAGVANAYITGNGLFSTAQAFSNELTVRALEINLGATASFDDFDTQDRSHLRLITTLSNVDITGFLTDVVAGKLLTITNASAGAITTNFITLKHQNASSSLNNRISNGGNTIGDDVVLFPGEQCTLMYRVASGNQARWGVQSVTRTTRKHIATTPAQITSNQNDYSTLGYDTLRLSTDASRDITGFANPLSGKPLIIMNVGSFNIVLKHQNASSTAANRMILGNAAADVTILPNDCVTLLYDSTSTRWRLISKSF